jgi:hypothetical protein
MTAIALPASFLTDFTAYVAAQASDPIVIGLAILAAGAPFVFWLLHRGIGLVPKGRK